jgi:hypothetical protein
LTPCCILEAVSSIQNLSMKDSFVTQIKFTRNIRDAYSKQNTKYNQSKTVIVCAIAS